MNKISKISSVVMLSALVLTGCSSTVDGNDGALSSDAKSTADDFISNYYNDLSQKDISTEEWNTSVNDLYTQMNELMVNALGQEKLDEISSSMNDNALYEAIDGMDESKKKELADKVKEINPLKDKYDFSDMTDTEVIYINLSSISNYISLSGSGVTITAPNDKMNFEGNEAYINLSDLQSDPAINNSETPGTFNIEYVDNTWKINGKKEVENMKEFIAESESQESAPAEAEESPASE